MQLVIHHLEVWLESYRAELMEALGMTARQLGMTEAAVHFMPSTHHPIGFLAQIPSPEGDELRTAPSSVQQQPLTLSVEGAAIRLGLSKAATYEAIQRHEIPFVRIGRRVLIPVKALEAFLRSLGPAGGGAGQGAVAILKLG